MAHNHDDAGSIPVTATCGWKAGSPTLSHKQSVLGSSPRPATCYIVVV